MQTLTYFLCNISVNIKTSHFLRLRMNKFRRDPDYNLYYVNISHLVVTGIFPVASLVILNYLVYKHLVQRRKQVKSLGKKKWCWNFIEKVNSINITVFQKNICIKTSFRSSNVIVSFSTPNEEPINVRKSTGPYAIWSSNIILIRLCFKGCFESKWASFNFNPKER